MKGEKWERDELFNELNSKSILNELKVKILQTTCSLLDDQMYTEHDAVHDLLEVVTLIELTERKVNPMEVKLALEKN